MATQREGESKSVDEGGPVKKEDPSLSSFDIAARSSSLGARNSKYVFVESNRDILAEIGYAEDKARLVEILRLVEWDPSFWSLNDEVVSWFNSDSATINEKINELKLSISEKEAQLVTARKKMRVKNRERGIFDPSLDVFPGLVDPPNPEEPFNDLHVLADAICLAMRELETVKIRGLENECKLASMDEKLRRLKIDAKTFEERSKHLDVNAQLMAVEMQNSMLNELLTLILQKIKKTTLDMENLNSTDSKVLLQIIKDTNDLNFKIINECYPHMETKPGLSQLLWLPHDLKHMSFDEYLKMVKPTREHSLDINIDWKQRKKDVKELGETRDQLMRLKRKVKMNDRRKASGEYGKVQYVTEAEIKLHSNVVGIDFANTL